MLEFDGHVYDAVVREQPELTSKGNKALGFLKRNLKTSNQQIKTQAYQALVRPKLEYS
jgi:hypothetical protein